MALKKRYSELEKEIGLYNHSVRSRVKFCEADSTGFVHNAQYLYMIEWARTEYFREIGERAKFEVFDSKFIRMAVHAEIEYFDKAGFLDEYEVLTRISFVKHSSFGMENIIRLADGRILAWASVVLVYLKGETMEPERIPDPVRELINELECGNARFIDNNG